MKSDQNVPRLQLIPVSKYFFYQRSESASRKAIVASRDPLILLLLKGFD